MPSPRSSEDEESAVPFRTLDATDNLATTTAGSAIEEVSTEERQVLHPTTTSGVVPQANTIKSQLEESTQPQPGATASPI